MENWIVRVSILGIFLFVFLQTGLLDKVLKMVEDLHFYHFTEEGKREKLRKKIQKLFDSSIFIKEVMSKK